MKKKQRKVFSCFIRELESALEGQTDLCSSERGKVARLEEDMEVEKRKFDEDRDEKQQIIAKLSKQLEVHEKNFEALKTELSQVINGKKTDLS